jgi:ABC-type uncharacterized transport system permease subunit
MTELVTAEKIVFLTAAALYLVAAIAGALQLRAGGKRYRRLLQPVVCLAVCIEALLLILRAAAIKAVPLTGLFESIVFLTIVFALIYLFFSIVITQVWFGSVMVWVIGGMVLLAGMVAESASQIHAVAATPWAIAHGTAMVSGGAAIMFATVNAFLYLLGRRRLKQKKVMLVLGKMPNVEQLKELNHIGLKVAFVMITFGLASGMGLAVVKSAALQMSFTEWLTDAKTILIIAAWMLLAAILILRYMIAIKDKTVAYLTLLVAFLILFAIIGTAVVLGTKHDFRTTNSGTIQNSGQV